MKILLVTEFFSPLERPVFSGGVETRAFYTARHLAKKHQVIVFCRRRRGEKAQEKQRNLLIKRLGKPVDNSVATIASLWSRLTFVSACLVESRKVTADLIEGSNFVSLIPAFLVGVLKRKPKVAWYPDVLLGDWQRYFGSALGFFGSMTERILLNLPWNQVITISPPVAKKLEKRGVDRAKIKVVACGIEPKDFSGQFKKFSQPTVCVVSRLLAYKRVKDVVSAVKLLKKDFPQLRLVIIGEGPEERNLRSQISELGLKGQVKVKKKVAQKELVRLLSKSHLLVNPSLIEGFGIVLAEAAAVGTPYVATNIPALKALDSKLQAGVLVTPRRPQQLAQAIKKLLTKKDFYRQKQAVGKKQVRQFSWENLTKETERAYEESARKRVAILIDAWFPFQGGGQVHVRETAKRLREDYDYRIKIFRGFSPALWARLMWDFFVMPRVIWEHLKNPFSLIHAHAYSAGVPGKLLSWLFKIPVVFTVHGSNTLDLASDYHLRKVVGRGLSFWVKYWLEKLFLTGINYDTTISVAKNFLKYPNKAKQVVVVPNGVAVDRFKIRDFRFKNEDKTIQLLFVGRLEKIKGVDLLLKALAQAKEQLPKFELRIVGDGSERGRLQQLAKELGLQSSVKFLGEITGKKLFKEYQRADLFVLPSLSEGQPLTVLEAWAHQTPVLVTKVGHNSQMVKERVTGFLVEPGNVPALKKGLLKAFDNREVLPEMGKQGYQLAKTRYTWEETVRKTVEVYKQILEGGRYAA